ncbi:MAG: ribosome maturation factor RimM [Actinomycetota bacterium]|nr:ribosome maturation factor RimM [Actinomycetota bacterium]
MEVLRDPVVIGVISAPHGVRGTLRVKSLGAGRHLRRGVEPVVEGERRRILAARETPKGFLIDLEGIEDRDLAGSLRGSELLLGREELDAPEEGEFYVGDLVGLEAYEEAGARVGSVADILETPAHEVLVVQDYDEEIYVPFTFEHVPKVDLEGGRIVVRPPETFSE